VATEGQWFVGLTRH